MQTFLPYPDLQASLQCLDYRRLGKQRVEAMQLIRAIENPGTSSWQNHPAARMWCNFVPCLKLYHDISISEWIKRGYRNTMQLFNPNLDEIVYPDWFGDEAFHLSHQSNLIRKLPEHYQHQWPEIGPHLEYVWPL